MRLQTGTRTGDEELAPVVPGGAGALDRRTAPAWFGWVAVALAAWLTGGGYLDAWAHRHMGFETFFTPWHAVLYSGWLANTAFFGAVAVRARRRGHPWRQVLPAGYGLSLVGCVAFGVGGVLDMVWHQAFGIERDFAAVISPTHLLLMASAAVILAGPLRSAWHGGSPRAGYGAVLSGAFLLAMLTFWVQFNHPFIDQWVSVTSGVMLPDRIVQEMGVQGVVLSAGMLSGVVLVMVSRFRLPPGSLTLVLGINAFLITVVEQLNSMVLVALLAGVIGDILLAVLRPSARRVGQLRLFAFVLPAELYLLYFATVLARSGTLWPVHVWTGSVALAGFTGLLLSLLVVPSASGSRARPEIR
jgi:hypothetical protein